MPGEFWTTFYLVLVITIISIQEITLPSDCRADVLFPAGELKVGKVETFHKSAPELSVRVIPYSPHRNR
ncbi:hypothetical protein FBY04_13834 [Pseudomonas sp. SJZ080]|nr:hypothetical protein FBY04_13834 [Pseudomonas sp. SJZ080]